MRAIFVERHCLGDPVLDFHCATLDFGVPRLLPVSIRRSTEASYLGHRSVALHRDHSLVANVDGALSVLIRFLLPASNPALLRKMFGLR